MATTQVSKIVVVGGVAAGASAACRARRLDEHAEIVVLERDEHTSFSNCCLPYHLSGVVEEASTLVVASADMLRKVFRLDVRTHTEATRIDRETHTVHAEDRLTGQTLSFPYDKLILAPVCPKNAPNLFWLRNVGDAVKARALVTDQDTDRPRVLIYGSGFIGLEVADQLTEVADVTLVTRSPWPLRPLDAEMTRGITCALRSRGVDVRFSTTVTRCDMEGDRIVGVTLSDGEHLSLDCLGLGLGVVPCIELARECGLSLGHRGGIVVNRYMQTSDPDVYAAGDAVEYPVVNGPMDTDLVTLAGPANKAGRIAGEHAVTGNARPMPKLCRASVCDIAGAVVAACGLSEYQCLTSGIPHRCVSAIGASHVGMMPGAAPVIAKLVFDPETGKILGAQASGTVGVDKQVSLVAVVMQFGGTVHDLVDTDHCYCPSVSTARTAMQQAGHVAANHMDGIVEATYITDPLLQKSVSGVLFLDVRSDAEVVEWAWPVKLPYKHIPHCEVRDRMAELEGHKSDLVLVSCKSAKRSHIVCRILMQSGFTNVRNCTGGVVLRQQYLDAVKDAHTCPKQLTACNCCSVQCLQSDTSAQVDVPMVAVSQM
ncbi:hypothetical protein KIPB_007851 [Kipferlia bialata]|uniref:Rhodanese domain-containing protein n=1 Tax=Kipferlia bialata TaxID=797122 RepID=A0A9K3CZL7_9EUKA|nr:hypothetical protein KIPB_007851 [Kipferlia bialata]|eukprot:g7851.t1